ncbi:MAG: glutaredoxin family protein [Betaproteobacteria bacterium]|nr:glutaredoxin family protein [Betaproteobacteria bacterium]
MNRAAALALVAATCAFVYDMYSAAHAQQIYRWIDDQGRTHVSDTPPPPTVRRYDRKRYGGGAVDSGIESFALKRAMQQAPVTLYTAPSCKNPCALARAALNRRGVPFNEVQVWNAATNAELERVTGSREVPALRVGSYVQKGYTQEIFDNALDIAGYPPAGTLPARKQAAPGAPEGFASAGGPASAAPDPTETTPQSPPGPYAPRFGGDSSASPAGSAPNGAPPGGPYTPRFGPE